MKIFSTQLDKNNTNRIELYHKICQIILLVSAILMVISAFVVMATFFEVEEFGLGFLAFFMILLLDFVGYFFASLVLNISCGLYYDVRRIRMVQETGAKCVEEQETEEETKEEAAPATETRRYVCPKCKSMVVYGCETCENCGQRFSWNG